MTLRTNSRLMQWTVWLCLALVFAIAYGSLSSALYGTATWSLFDPRTHRLAIPLVVLFVWLARETRWDGMRRRGNREESGEPSAVSTAIATPSSGGEASAAPAPAPNAPAPDVPDAPTDEAPHTPAAPTDEPDEAMPPPPDDMPNSQHLLRAFATSENGEDASGEELYRLARTMAHQPIPNLIDDGQYLALLGRSAATGYAPALVKLAEYAIRRGAWVEAYYWIKQARRNGMRGLSPMMRDVRMRWSMAGFPRQSLNVSKLFPAEAGSLGRALLSVDSGHNAAKAREFLKVHYPEFLP